MKKKTTTQKATLRASKKPVLRDLTTLENRAQQVKAGQRAGRRKK